VSNSVRAVERALDILLCFTQDNPTLSLTQISEHVGMHKSTIHRLLTTLEAKRFVIRDKSSGMYQLGFRFVELASIMLQDMDIQRWAQPYLQHLVDLSGETVDLAMLDDDRVVYLQVVESPQRVKIAAAVGEQLPVYCTATGKAFLAYLPEYQVNEILAKGMAKFTDHTLVSPADLYQDLCKTRELGFAISKEEYEKDINAIAAPILDSNGYPMAVIAIVGPSFRLSDDCIMMLGKSLLETTSTIAREVGLSALPVILPKTKTPSNAESLE
jgi:DNA-binding IclR family transcriptional regulator